MLRILSKLHFHLAADLRKCHVAMIAIPGLPIAHVEFTKVFPSEQDAQKSPGVDSDRQAKRRGFGVNVQRVFGSTADAGVVTEFNKNMTARKRVSP